MVCARCGTENPPHAKFCLECASPLAAPEAEPVRKRVTVLFCDIVGSTALGDSSDPEALRGVLARYFERMKATLERHGGTVEKFIGDAVMAVFGVPVLHEDDAVRALRAAAEMRDALPGLGVQARIGVNTGEVVAGAGNALVTGDAVNVAARLEQAAPAGEVYVGAETAALARGVAVLEPLEPLDLKGKAQRVAAFRLVDVVSTQPVRASLATFVGRERECRVLREAYDVAVSDRVCQLFTLLGVAGVGKSRLVAEFLGDVDATVVQGRCLSYGEGITYWPVVEVVKQLRPEERELGPRVAGPIASLLANDGTASASEIAFAVRRLFEEAARERPLVVVWDDVHWGEESFLDLIEHVADWSRDAPILLLCMARPELLDRRTGWGGGKLHAVTTLLEPLDRALSRELLVQLLPELDEELGGRILAAADGNPLFVEEMAAVVEASPAEGVVVPPTIQALIAARLDQLPSPERAVLERGAVEGQVFHRSAVEALAPAEAQVASRVAGLVRKELVRPEAPVIPDDEAYRFRHLLIREAAYDALSKATRADLHERFAQWLEQRGRDLVELDEISGYHLEQAARYLREVDGDERRATRLAAGAATRLRAGGRAALEREDPRAATSLLRRAATLAADRELAAEIEAELAIALADADEFAAALEVAARLRATEFDRPRAIGELVAIHVEQQTDSAASMAAALARTEELLATVAPSGDLQLIARVRLAQQVQLFFLGRTEDAIDAARLGADAAAAAGDRRTQQRAVVARIAAETHGATPVPVATMTCEQQLPHLGQPWSRSFACQKLARLYAEAGRFDDARAAYAEAKELALEYGLRMRRGVQTQDGAEIDLLAGDARAAERELREGYAVLAELGETGFRSTVAGLLGESLLAQGRIDEALAAAEDALELAQADDPHTIAIAKAVQARVAAARDDAGAAVRLAAEAVAATHGTDYLDSRASALLALAHASIAAGDSSTAAAAAAEAVDLYARKGNVVRLAAARALLESAGVAA